MLDDLRNSAEQSYPENGVRREFPDQEGEKTPRPKKKLLLGMTAQQRFILALLLLFVTCVGGMLCLVVTGSVFIG